MATPADQLWISEDLGNFVAMSQPQFPVLFFDVVFPLGGQLDLGAKPRTNEATDHADMDSVGPSSCQCPMIDTPPTWGGRDSANVARPWRRCGR